MARQTEAAQRWATAHGLELDTELTLTDSGVSAFHGKNAAEGALAAFLRAVEDGRVPAGSYLIVESLDRLSRQAVRKAARTLEDILAAGVAVVDLEGGGKVYTIEAIDNDPFAFVEMAFRFLRANQESVMKGRRVRAAYDAKRKTAVEQIALPPGTPRKRFTTMTPAWIKWDQAAAAYKLIEDRAALVREIFEAVAAGKGQHAITRELNTRGVTTWSTGRRPVPADYWHQTYVGKILRNPAVLGTFTPHQVEVVDGKRKRKALTAIEGYFPAVLTGEEGRALWDAVQRRFATIQARGRHADKTMANLFTGLLRCAVCGGTVTRIKRPDAAYLICARANSWGKCKRLAVRYADVEEAFVDRVEGIIADAPRGADTADLDAQARQAAVNVDGWDETARDVAEALPFADPKERPALRAELTAVLEQRELAEKTLRRLLEKRNTLAAPWVLSRFQTVQEAIEALAGDGAGDAASQLQAANGALRQALARIDLDPLAGTLTLHWHHSDETQDIWFFSKWRWEKART